ncbi:MAG: helix-turn-helix domain-containing protein [Patescibacteria group bacterium]
MANLMHYKQDAYEQALAFRRRGFTYSEIAKICNVSVSTLSNWLKNEPFSKQVAETNLKRATVENTKRLASINKARTTERKGQYAEIIRLAEIEYKNYRTSPLFMAGLMLYVSEGDTQNDRLIRLTNSRTDLHRIFIRFLTTYLGVEKPAIRFWLLLYPDLDEVTCMKLWCKKTGISPGQFYKNQVIQGRSSKRTLHFGVGNTIIGSTLLKKKLMRWIELATKELEK